MASALQSYLSFARRGIGYGERWNIFINQPQVFRERHLDGAAKYFAENRYLLKDDEEKEGEKTFQNEEECKEYLTPFVGMVVYASPDEATEEMMNSLGNLAEVPEKTLPKDDFVAICKDLEGDYGKFRTSFDRFLESIQKRLEKAGVELSAELISQFLFAAEHKRWELHRWFVNWELNGMLEKFLEAYDVWVEDGE